MYFAANQQKQKAFDQYYNAMATSNFKQGRKLRALINQEADDAALTEKLASLYASSTAKSHEYDYDTVSKKLRGRVKKPAEGKTMKARMYVHESTDSQQTPTPTRRASIDEFLQDRSLGLSIFRAGAGVLHVGMTRSSFYRHACNTNSAVRPAGVRNLR